MVKHTAQQLSSSNHHNTNHNLENNSEHTLVELVQHYRKLLDDNQQRNDKLRDDNQHLHEQVNSLTHQLDWFKRQVFGSTSEKRRIDIPGQGNLLQGWVDAPSEQAISTEQITYQRKKGNKQRGESVNDSGLRFDESVQVKEIRIRVPELEGPYADQYIVIDEHVTYRLAQRRSSYVVLKYIQPVIKRKDTGVITTVAAPTPLFEKSIADVSFIVGLIIDKCVYHQPLHRQHQKLQFSGITLSRTTSTNVVKRAIALLEPIYDALLMHILLSKVLAMDDECRDARGRATQEQLPRRRSKPGANTKG